MRGTQPVVGRQLLWLVFLCWPLLVAAAPAASGWSRSGPARSVPGQPAPAWPGAGRQGGSRRHGAPATAINVNTADVAALVALKGVGEKKARAIVAYRKAHGPFASLDDFEEVPGIGPALIEANRERILFR